MRRRRIRAGGVCGRQRCFGPNGQEWTSAEKSDQTWRGHSWRSAQAHRSQRSSNQGVAPMYASAAVRLAFLLFAALGLGACAAANRFADNAVEYNLQSEKVQDSGLLLNVIRASKRRPLEFAEIQTITGANPASGSAGFSIPLTHPGTTPATVTPTLTLSGGPSVTV